MQQLSVVIVCKNEAGVIGKTIKSFSGLTDDVVVYDSGSTDGTQQVVRESFARLIEGNWLGYGETKNKANELAKYDWILSLDADEEIDEKLKKNLLKLDLDNEHVAYRINFKNFFGKKWLRFGEWGNDKHIRVYNRRMIRWNDAQVHESLILPKDIEVAALKGFVLHRTMKDIRGYRLKIERYAAMSAEKYFSQGRRSSLLYAGISTFFSFLNNYFFRLGFLDGKEGFICASMTAKYTWMKYNRLNELNKQRGG